MSAIVGKSREPTIVRSRIPLQPLLPKNKSKRGRPRSKSAPAVLNTQKEKGKKRKQWTNEEMENAIHDVTDRSMPVLWAAKKHGIPKSTLHDRISGKVSHGEKPGPKPLLTATEESEFVTEFDKTSLPHTSNCSNSSTCNLTLHNVTDVKISLNLSISS